MLGRRVIGPSDYTECKCCAVVSDAPFLPSFTLLIRNRSFQVVEESSLVPRLQVLQLCAIL
jgi:hypothetical protein